MDFLLKYALHSVDFFIDPTFSITMRRMHTCNERVLADVGWHAFKFASNALALALATILQCNFVL